MGCACPTYSLRKRLQKKTGEFTCFPYRSECEIKGRGSNLRRDTMFMTCETPGQLHYRDPKPRTPKFLEETQNYPRAPPPNFLKLTQKIRKIPEILYFWAFLVFLKFLKGFGVGARGQFLSIFRGVSGLRVLDPRSCPGVSLFIALSE